MKDKKVILIIAGVIAVLVIAYVLFMRPGANSPLIGNSIDVVESAFSGSGSAMCEYTDAEGVVTVAYIENGMVRTNMTGGPQNVMASMIMRDNTIWTWDGNTMQGMMMELPEVTPGAVEEEVDTETEYDADQVKAELEAYKDSCQATNVDDSLFEPPTDVTFQSMSDMMEGMPGLPAGYEQYMPQ